MYICTYCNQHIADRKLAADGTVAHQKCRLLRLLNDASEVQRRLEKEVNDLRYSATTLSDRLSRYDFMRMFLFKNYGVDILPTNPPHTPYPESLRNYTPTAFKTQTHFMSNWGAANEQQAEGRLHRTPRIGIDHVHSTTQDEPNEG